MKSRVSLVALMLLSAPAFGQSGAVAPEEPQGAGPRGSSQPAAGERRFDAIGYAAIGGPAGIMVSAPGLAARGYAELTAIDTGRTIVVAVGDEPTPPGRVAIVSAEAAAALGLVGDPAGVRVRPVSPPAPEIAALRAGQPITRAEAPAALLAALRKRLGPAPVGSNRARLAKAPVAKLPKGAAKAAARPTSVAAAVPPPPAKPAAAEPTAAAVTLTPGFYVQYAALSALDRATALAKKVDGVVEQTDAVFRVHRGPFANDADAKRERARAVGLGYRDAQIVRIIP